VNERIAHILIDTTSIRIDSLELRNEGPVRHARWCTINEDPNVTACISTCAACGWRTPIRSMRAPKFHGLLSGDGKRVTVCTRRPYLLSHLRIDSLAVDRAPHRRPALRCQSWNNAENLIDLSGELRSAIPLRMLGFTGLLAPGKAEELDVDLLLRSVRPAGFIEPFLPERHQRGPR
jgi:hypothetical protein